MQVTINGALRELPGSLTLRELLHHLELEEGRIAIERNRTIVKPEEWESVRVEPGDELEIVHFVGGG
jgi:thiamine biosynthesis protein ThiS